MKPYQTKIDKIGGGGGAYGCYGAIHGVVGGDAMKINGVRVKPLIFVKVTYLVDMQVHVGLTRTL